MGTKTKELTPDQKNQLAQFLLNNSNGLRVKDGKSIEAATKFGIHKRTVQKIWTAAKEQIQEGKHVSFINNKKNSSHKNKICFDEVKLKSLAFSKRSTIRAVARELSVSKSQVGRWVKSGVIMPHSNAIKTELTPQNVTHRLNFCLSQLETDVVQNKIAFSGMFNVIHIDEKWFYMSKVVDRYYLVPGEEEPHRACKSKRFIPKVMFMCAVSRSMFNDNGECIFDGKIGIWPFTRPVPTLRNSKNRERGTLVTKPIDSITKEVIRECIIKDIIPAIKAKWPPNATRHIIIQQDNAKPHITDADEEFRLAATTDGFNIQLLCQPANSPDFNVNDLGWFREIQSLQVETASYNVDDLVKNVLLSYDNLPCTSLNKVFLTLQSCLIETMKQEGTNKYKIPHMSKDRLIREGNLPIVLEVDEQIVRDNVKILLGVCDPHNLKYNISNLIVALGY